MRVAPFARTATATAVLSAVLVTSACSSAQPARSPAASPSRPVASTPASTPSAGTHAPAASSRTLLAGFPRPRHVVVVVMENHSYSDVIGNPQAPYLNSLARHGRSLTRMHAVTHPSEPNYLALFSGSTHGLTDDRCPVNYRSGNLAQELLAKRLGFRAFSESLPRAGSRTCRYGDYARKHAPWVDFPALPASVNQPFTAFPRSNFAGLPAVSFVVPNQANDMHNGTVAQGDAWVSRNLGAYGRWAVRNHSMLIVTWDEDDRSESNRIPTMIVGQGVTHAPLGTSLTHYSLLRLLEDLYGLHRLGYSATAARITLP